MAIHGRDMPGYSDDPSRYRRVALAFVARADATRDSNLQAKFRHIAGRYHALAEEVDDMAEGGANVASAVTGPVG
jgi:hypothetical protein